MPSFRAIETAAQSAEPIAQELAVAARSRLGELVGSAFSHSGPGGSGEEMLSRRRFLRHSVGSAELDATPTDVDWQRRKDELSEVIVRRIVGPRLTEQEFFQPGEAFKPEDRPVVRRILEYSAGNSTDAGLRASFNSVAGKLKELFDDRDYQLFAASPSSPGNMHAYLFRKSLHSQDGTNYLASSGDTITGWATPAVIFDDLRHMKDADRQALKWLPIRRPVVAVDLNGFERAVNLIDFANGQDAVIAKLDGLLNDTKELVGREPSLKHEEAIRRVLYEPFDQSVAAFHRELRLEQRPIQRPIWILRSEPIDLAVAFQQTIKPEQVTSFLAEQFKDNSGARIMAAELLAEDVEFHTLGGLIPQLKNLQEALLQSAQRHQFDPAGDMFVVGAETGAGQGSSDAFMTYLYKEATGLPDERIVSWNQLEALRRAEKLNDKRVVALDDAIYTGAQARCLLKFHFDSYNSVALAALSSSSRFARRMHEGKEEAQGLRELVTLQSDLPWLSTDDNPFFEQATATERDLLRELDAWSHLSTIKVFPHMTSDTTLPWLSQFAEKFRLTFE